jgi:hypothetical protein
MSYVPLSSFPDWLSANFKAPALLPLLHIKHRHDNTDLPLKLLGNRIVYWYSPKAAGTNDSSSSTAEAAVAALSSPAQGGNKKKVRKLQQQQQQQQIGAAQGTTGLLQGGYLGSELLGYLEFTDDLDYLVSARRLMLDCSQTT